jgi:hypothetical protein
MVWAKVSVSVVRSCSGLWVSMCWRHFTAVPKYSLHLVRSLRSARQQTVGVQASGQAAALARQAKATKAK